MVESSNGNFIVSYERKNSSTQVIGEMSSDGLKFIRTVEHLALHGLQLKHRPPHYLAIGERDRIFVADYLDNKVSLYNSKLTDHTVLLDDDKHRINLPQRLCYIRGEHKLFVVHGCSPTSVSIFHLSTSGWHGSAGHH